MIWLVGLGLITMDCHRSEPVSEIRIGFVVEKPSPIAHIILDAAHLAVSTVNSAGGIEVDGRFRTVALVVEETENTPEGATRASLELINREKVVAIVGSSYSRNAIPSGAVAERAGVPMISPGSSHTQVTSGRRYVFRVSYTNPFQARAIAGFARQELELTTVAVLYDVAETYSREIEEEFRQAFEAAGGRVVASESFVTGADDFAGQLERIRVAAPDAVLLPNYRKEVILQVSQARRLGLDAVFLGTDSWPVAGKVATEDLEGAFLSLGWHRGMAAEIPETKEFLNRFRSVYGSEPDDTAAMTYDAFGLLFAAIATTVTGDSESVREALAQIEGYRGVTGLITFRSMGGDPHRSLAMTQYRDGELRLFKMVDAEPMR